MRAALFYGAGDVRVESVPDPPEPAATQVVIAPRWAGICGTDLHEYVSGPLLTSASPHPLTGATLPQILGHELSGLVEAVGASVTSVRPGDRVAVMPLEYCGRCQSCRRGLNHLCTSLVCTGLTSPWGGFAEKVLVEDFQVVPLPEDVSWDQGALVEPANVAAYGVARAGVSPGERVLITGGGPIGLLAVLAAEAAGAGEVILSEPNQRRAAAARKLTDSTVIDPTSDDLIEAVLELTDGRGVDAAVECSGSQAGFLSCIEASRPRGTISQVGLAVAPIQFDPPACFMPRELSLVSSWAFPVHEFDRMVKQIGSGAVAAESIVTARVALDDIATDGFDILTGADHDELKILVKIS